MTTETVTVDGITYYKAPQEYLTCDGCEALNDDLLCKTLVENSSGCKNAIFVLEMTYITRRMKGEL